MAELLLFHHAQGLTAGCRSFADELRAAGHVVHTPDLYEGRTFTTLTGGVAHAGQVGFDTIIERDRLAAPLGVMPAQLLTQTRPGANGALFFHSCVPLAEFGRPWPQDVPLQIHTMNADEWGDLDVARPLVEAVESGAHDTDRVFGSAQPEGEV